MNNLNVAIYRAKREENDEEVIGFYLPTMLWYDSFLAEPSHTILVRTPHDILNPQNGYYYEQYFIDETTLAIHFPDMLDSQENKIFASLSEDGKGGDLFLMDEKYTLVFDGRLKLKGLKIKIQTYKEYLQKQKVIGIQKWK